MLLQLRSCLKRRSLFNNSLRVSLRWVWQAATFVVVACLFGCSAKSDGECSATLHCGICDHAIQINFVDRDSGELVGREQGESLKGMEIQGESGECASVESCFIYAKDHNPETIYAFDVLYRGTLLASYSLTPESDPEPAKCCICGYETRVVELTLDWSELSQ